MSRGRSSAGGAVAYAVVAAPWGPIHVAATERGLVALELLTPTEVFLARLERRFPDGVLRNTASGPATLLLRRVADALQGYFRGSVRDLDLPVDLEGLSEWDRRVLRAVRSVPYGQVTSYGRIARMVGSPGAARAVGSAVGRNPVGLVIPCHRVIARDGSLGGYGGDWAGSRERLVAIKANLLGREGVSLPPATLFGG